jgi:hypothetical protein
MKSIQNFIEKLEFIYNNSIDMSEVIEKIGKKNNFSRKQYSEFEDLISVIIEKNRDIESVKNWDYYIDCILNY